MLKCFLIKCIDKLTTQVYATKITYIFIKIKSCKSMITKSTDWKAGMAIGHKYANHYILLITYGTPDY